MPVMWRANDGFIGTKIGEYTTREGEYGIVLQQIGTRVVHVYRVKYLTPEGQPDVRNESDGPTKV